MVTCLIFVFSYVNSVQIKCNTIVRMGSYGDGGWDVCDDEKYRPKQPCLIYSFGLVKPNSLILIHLLDIVNERLLATIHIRAHAHTHTSFIRARARTHTHMHSRMYTCTYHVHTFPSVCPLIHHKIVYINQAMIDGRTD